MQPQDDVMDRIEKLENVNRMAVFDAARGQDASAIVGALEAECDPNQQVCARLRCVRVWLM